MKKILLTIVLSIFLFPTNVWAEDLSTLAVINFTNRNQNKEWQWLSKGLADMLITDLSNTKKFKIVEREKMQQFIDEIKLADTGLIESETAIKLGSIAKVNKVLFGSFLVEGETIVIEGHIVNMSDQQLDRVEWVEGNVKDILDLEKELALNIIENLHVELTEKEATTLKYKPTDSIDAATRFYQGIDFYDGGKFFDALREFRLAQKKDTKYAKPRLLQAQVYENLGEYEHAAIAFKSLADNNPQSDLADDALFYASKLYFRYLNDLKETIKIAHRIIEMYPNGEIPEWTEIVPQVDGYSEIKYWIDTDPEKRLPLQVYLRALTHIAYERQENFPAALQELELGNEAVPLATYGETAKEKSPGRFQNERPFYAHRITTLVQQAYKKKGVVLKPNMPKVIRLSKKNSTYSEDYSTQKRYDDAFQLASKWHPVYHNNRWIKYPHDNSDQTLHNIYHPGKEEWIGIADGYVFAAPDGYWIESIDVEFKGFQTLPYWIKINVGNFADPYMNVTSARAGKISPKRRVPLLAGSKMASFWVTLKGDWNSKQNQKAYINSWKMKANLVPFKETGIIKIDTKIDAFLNPIRTGVPGVGMGAWKESPYRRCPCTIYNVPVGKHEILGIYPDSKREGSRRQVVRQIEVKANEILDLDFAADPKAIDWIARAMPGWKDHVFVTDKTVHPVRGVHLFLDRDEKFWLMWHQSGDIWLDHSVDAKTWTKGNPLPAPINTQNDESQFSITQGEDGKYYMAFIGRRGEKDRLLVSSSKDMIRWTNPKAVTDIEPLKEYISLIQLRNGTYRIYFRSYHERNHRFYYINSKDFNTWDEPGEIEITWQYGSPSLVKQDSLGKFWMVMWGRKDMEKAHSFWVRTSRDGIEWEESQHVKTTNIGKDWSNNYPCLIFNNDGELVLSWEKGNRLAYSRSKDGVTWTESHAELSRRGRSAYPRGPASIVQRKDGVYVVAYPNWDQDLWISFSENPFY